MFFLQKQKQLHIGFELLDTDEERDQDSMEFGKWCEYLDHYINADDTMITEEMKEKMDEKPVFLQRFVLISEV